MTMQLSRQDIIALNNFRQNIGLNIHKARVKHKITIEKLAKISGLKAETIEAYEMGSNKMCFEVLLKLAQILKVGIGDFMK